MFDASFLRGSFHGPAFSCYFRLHPRVRSNHCAAQRFVHDVHDAMHVLGVLVCVSLTRA